MLGRGPLTPLNGPIPFQLPLSASDAPVGGSQPKTGKKRILSSRQQYISKWKTKACDVVKLLVDRGKMVDPGDIAGLESFLAKADQLETNFVSVSDASLAQEKETNAKLNEKYMGGLRSMKEIEAERKELLT